MEFTQEYLSKNKIAIECKSSHEARIIVDIFGGKDDYDDYDQELTCFAKNGDKDNYEFYCAGACRKDKDNIIPASEVIKLWEERQKPKGKIIGYKVPFDMFNDNISKGDVYVKATCGYVYYPQKNNYGSLSNALPKEIVEQWEPVYGEPEKDLSREEITKKWVEENGVKVGDKVKVLKKFESGIYSGQTSTISFAYDMSDLVGVVFEVDSIGSHAIYLGGWYWPVESLQKVTPRLVPYTYEDRGMFRGKWIVVNDTLEALIITITKDKISVQCYGFLGYFTYEEALEKCKYIDGTPFGKEVYE